MRSIRRSITTARATAFRHSAFQFPKDTSEAIVKKVNEALSKALAEQETCQRPSSRGLAALARPGFWLRGGDCVFHKTRPYK
jgi:hypothetical protein